MLKSRDVCLQNRNTHNAHQQGLNYSKLTHYLCVCVCVLQETYLVCHFPVLFPANYIFLCVKSGIHSHAILLLFKVNNLQSSWQANEPYMQTFVCVSTPFLDRRVLYCLLAIALYVATAGVRLYYYYLFLQ